MAGWHHRLDGHECEQLQALVMHREARRAALNRAASALDTGAPTAKFGSCI